MYNRQEYSHNFALSDRCFSTCLLCYSSWRKFFSQTSMLHTYLLQSLWCFKNDLHICSKRHYHDINFPGRAVAFSLNEDQQGGHGTTFQKRQIFAILIPALQGMPTQVTKWIQIVRFAKKLHFFSVNFMLNRAILLPTFFFSQSVDTFIHFLIFFPLQLLLETRTMTQ